MNFIELVEASREYAVDVHETKKLAVYFFGDNLEIEYKNAVTHFSEKMIKAEKLSDLEYEYVALIKRANQIFNGGCK